MAWKRTRRGDARHGKLELLGGRLDRGEEPAVALLRELGEEEQSGLLARLVERGGSLGAPLALDVEGTPHYLYEVTLREDEAAALVHDPRESLGFALVPAEALLARDLDGSLTPRTRAILDALGRREGGTQGGGAGA